MIVCEIQSAFSPLHSRKLPFPHTDCLLVIFHYVERVVSQIEKPLSSFNRFSSSHAQGVKRRTLKQTSIPPHMHNLSLPIATPVPLHTLLSHIFLSVTPSLCLSPARCGAELELEVTAWHVIVTSNEIK